MKPGEKVLLVDDILRTGRKLSELKNLVEGRGGEVVGMAVVVYQPNPSRVISARCRFVIWPISAAANTIPTRRPAICANRASPLSAFGCSIL